MNLRQFLEEDGTQLSVILVAVGVFPHSVSNVLRHNIIKTSKIADFNPFPKLVSAKVHLIKLPNSGNGQASVIDLRYLCIM